jgi:hypothetical protein
MRWLGVYPTDVARTRIDFSTALLASIWARPSDSKGDYEIHLGHCFSALGPLKSEDLIEPWQCSIRRSIRSPCGKIAPDGPI